MLDKFAGDTIKKVKEDLAKLVDQMSEINKKKQKYWWG